MDSAAAKDEHILRHFIQETCGDCDQNLIRIGGNLYTLHCAATCIKRDSARTSELTSDIDHNNRNFKDDNTSSVSSMSPTCSVEEVYIKIEPREENEQPIVVEVVQNDQKSPHNSSETVAKLHVEKQLKCIEKPKQAKRSNKNELPECDVCGKMLANKSSLRRHKIVVHSSRGSIFCKICTRVFSTDQELLKHKSECILKRPNYDPALEHISFECYICKATFKTKRRIVEHIRFKHDPNVKTFKCELCGRKFFGKWLLNSHLNRIHLNIKKFVCSVCGAAFTTKYRLKTHENQHTGNTPFVCTYESCRKQFKSRSARESHMRIHIGKKPYRCNIHDCNERFIDSIVLKRHKQTVHGIFINKFVCNECDGIFPTKASLKSHDCNPFIIEW